MKRTSKTSKTTRSEAERTGQVSNDALQFLIKREVRRVKKRGRRVWFTPKIMDFTPELRAFMREHPDTVPDFVENYRRLEYDY